MHGQTFPEEPHLFWKFPAGLFLEGAMSIHAAFLAPR
jgi:hypothetical protein